MGEIRIRQVRIGRELDILRQGKKGERQQREGGRAVGLGQNKTGLRVSWHETYHDMAMVTTLDG